MIVGVVTLSLPLLSGVTVIIHKKSIVGWSNLYLLSFIFTTLHRARPLPIFSPQAIIVNAQACADINSTQHSKEGKDCVEAIRVRLRDHVSFFIAKVQVFQRECRRSQLRDEGGIEY